MFVDVRVTLASSSHHVQPGICISGIDLTAQALVLVTPCLILNNIFVNFALLEK